MGILDLLNVVDMQEINKRELLQIVGGVSITGTLINAVIKTYETILGFGQTLGSSVRRYFDRSLCDIK